MKEVIADTWRIYRGHIGCRVFQNSGGGGGGGAPRIRIMKATTSSNFVHFEDEQSVGAGQLKATSPDLTLNSGLKSGVEIILHYPMGGSRMTTRKFPSP